MHSMDRHWLWLSVSACVFVLCLPGLVRAKWYILTAALPNTVYIIDADTDQVVKTIPLEGRGPILTVIPNPTRPQFAYVVTDLNQSVAVVDLDEGREVLRFDLSNDNELVRTMAVEVNPAGDRLYIHEMPLKKDLGTYEMLETRIRVVDLETNTVKQVFSRAPTGDGSGGISGREKAVRLQHQPGHHRPRPGNRAGRGHDSNGQLATDGGGPA